VEPSIMPSQPNWTVADAKARLSEVIDKARHEGPQTITKNGRSTAVLVSIEEWERKTKRSGSLADFLLASPLRGADLELERLRDDAKDIKL
jgi:prevent-host-death family protein